MNVTVGVPVFNGGSMLRESLGCLAGQTLRDFHVLIYDNASTDETPHIAEEICSADRRFRYVRQPENKGPAQNFIDVMEACETPFFLWRAHDDASDPEYLRTLLEALEAAPDAVLAAARIEQTRVGPDGAEKRRTVPFRLARGDGAGPLIHNMRAVHQSWFYGLWRHAAIREIWHRIYDAYPYAWASDFLMLFAALAQDGVTGSDRVAFRQRIVEKPSQHLSQAAPRDARDLAERRRRFAAICAEEVGLAERPWLERVRLAAAIDRFTARRVGSRGRVAKLWMSGLHG
ncbi:MAG: glycosyltransferase family 2 protein [Pseudomonadota bacterium]